MSKGRYKRCSATQSKAYSRLRSNNSVVFLNTKLHRCREQFSKWRTALGGTLPKLVTDSVRHTDVGELVKNGYRAGVHKVESSDVVGLIELVSMGQPAP